MSGPVVSPVPIFRPDMLPIYYFGGTDIAGNPSGVTNNNDNTIIFWKPYTCPGSGNKLVQELSAMMYPTGGLTGIIRLGIYDSTGTTLLGQGISSTSVIGTFDNWQGHMTPASLSVNPLILVGGTDYILALTIGGITCYSTHVDETRSNGSYNLTDYTGGLPAAVPSITGSYYMYPIRCGVI